MDNYLYTVLGADEWLRCDGLHRRSFLTLLQDVLYRFGYTGTPTYSGCLYHEFGCGHCDVHVDIPTHPSDPSLMAWFTTATRDDLGNTMENAAHQALMKFYEHHLPGLTGIAVALFPIRDMGDPMWSERLAATCDPALPTDHARWAFMTCYAQHVSSQLLEVTTVGAHQHLCLEVYDHQLEAKDCLIADMRKGNMELL
jgi:hypothetical protein